jgi:hypothetical protein
LKAGDEERVLLKMTDEGMIDPASRWSNCLPRSASLLADPLIRPVFSSRKMKIRVEAEILRENGDVYRPDRVIIREKKRLYWILKPGNLPKEQEKQIGLYGKLLNELGYTKVKKYLVFIEPEIKVVEV